MATVKTFDDVLTGWLEAEAVTHLPDRTLLATFERTRATRQQRGWGARFAGVPVSRFASAVASAAAVVVVAVVTVYFLSRQPAMIGPSATATPAATPLATPLATQSATPLATQSATPLPTPTAESQSPFAGTWISTSDGDGGTQTMTVHVSADGGVDIVVTDTIASVCSSTPSTMTGSGTINGKKLVIPTPDYRCDDGSEPHLVNGDSTPLNEVLRDLTYTLDPTTDTLKVKPNEVWLHQADASPSALPQQSPDLGIFAPVADRIVYQTQDGIWGVDPASSDPATRVQLTSETGAAPLGWSSDGTRLLIQKGDENLFVLHADGSETQVTDQLSGFKDIPGSARPTGATISPDGSRVVFAGLTRPWQDGRSCHDGALFAVDADGGPAEVLWKSQFQNGIVRDPSFSPDGKQIAFVDGYCDSSHSVWVMNVDGTDAHQIVTDNDTPLGAGHVYGLAWSPAGNRIALGFEGAIYTFATDGSGFTQVISYGDWPFWSLDGSQIVYAEPCATHTNGCGLTIAAADGSNVRRLFIGPSGPWHPGIKVNV